MKKAPSTHKLGAIYVIDSVVRRWIEVAKQNKLDLNLDGRGEPGTYPAAVKRVTELMPALFDDMMKVIPAEQKKKLESMIGIWEKGATFPARMLSDFRMKMGGAAGASVNQAAVQTNGAVSAKTGGGDKFSAPVPSRPVYTPIGYPPQHLYDQGLIPRKPEQASINGTTATNSQPSQQQTQYQPQAAPPAATDVNSILAALANVVPKPTPQQPSVQPAAAPPHQTPQLQLPPNLAALFGPQNGIPAMPAPQPPVQPQAHPYATPQAAQPFQLPPGFAPQPPPSVPQYYTQAPPPPPPQQQQQDPLGPLRSILPRNILNDQQKLIQALKLLQDLQKDGIPIDQWGPVLQAFEEQYQPPTATTNAYSTYDTYGGRRRSRSPERDGVRRRASPVYGTYEETASRNHDDEDERGGRGRGRYRQRSPPPARDSPAPLANANNNPNLAMNGNPMQPKYIGHDTSLPSDHIKVLSRTLFVGGANGTQAEIQQLFERFGRVQTCIANRDKRHAFVKMTSRTHALNAKAGMERLQSANDKETMGIARQTKWGVGFGPRECCDYAKGESIIPVGKLTDADVKWLLTAEYGGTGGRRIEGGMILEEPDIEIGAGVSSKAMSKRVMPDSGPPQSGNSNKRQHREEGNGNGNGGGQSQRRDRKRGQHYGDHGSSGWRVRRL